MLSYVLCASAPRKDKETANIDARDTKHDPTICRVKETCFRLKDAEVETERVKGSKQTNKQRPRKYLRTAGVV